MLEGKKSVLFVEDELEITEGMKTLLESENYSFVSTTTARDAITKADLQEFDIILTDINLERGSGVEVIKAIRNNPKSLNKNTPIIALSSHFQQEIVKMISKYIQAAFVKPYNLAEVLEAIEKHIKKDS